MARREETANTKYFVQLYTGILDHLRAGMFTTDDFAIYVLLHLNANHKTGLVFTNTADLVEGFGGREQSGTGYGAGTIERMVRKSLERLRNRGYINYATTTSRRRYPILIHKFVAREGEFKGWMLDAFAPDTLTRPAYVRRSEDLTPRESGVPDESVENPSGVREEPVKSPSGVPEESVKSPQTSSYYKEVRVKSLRGKESRGEENQNGVADSKENLTESDANAERFRAFLADHPHVNLVPFADLEKTMPQNTWEGALRLSRFLLAAAGRSLAEESVEDAARTLLPLVNAGPDWEANWKAVRARVIYVAFASRHYEMQGENGPFTWYDAICGPRTNDPAASFRKNYAKIAAATDEAEEEARKLSERRQFQDEYGGVPDHANAATDAAFAAARE